MADVLQVEKREKLGSTDARRLRRVGRVPVVLYGHGQQNEHLSVDETAIQLVVRHHSKTVELTGAITDTALVTDMQWDPLGIEVLHVDLVRVNLRESVEVSVPIHLHGEPVGVRDGGVLLENEHEVDIRCPAGSIPDHLTVDVKSLAIGEQRFAGDLELPPDIELLTPAETVIVHVEQPAREEEEVEGEPSATGAEPELISRGGEQEEEED